MDKRIFLLIVYSSCFLAPNVCSGLSIEASSTWRTVGFPENRKKIVEFKPDDHSLNKNRTSRTKNSGKFEFIIGGSSKDGVPKRSQLEVIEL